MANYKRRSATMQKTRRLELLVPNSTGHQKAKEAQLDRWNRQVSALDIAGRRRAQKNLSLGRFTSARGGKDDYTPLRPGRRDVAIPRLTRDKTNSDGSITKVVCTTQDENRRHTTNYYT